MTVLTIGQVAKHAGVTVETLRFYEKQGLIPSPIRNASGYRVYEAAMVKRVRFIQRAKDLGFTLKEIGELLNLRQTRETSCLQVRQVAQTKVTEIDQKLQELQRMRRALTLLATRCEVEGTLGECPILDVLDETESE